MAHLVLPHSVDTGSDIVAAELQENFVATRNVLNGNIDSTNILDASIRPSDILGEGAVVSTLPGSPIDGQVAHFQNAAMAAQGVVWKLRYRAGSALTEKWEFVGGAFLTGNPADGSVSGLGGSYAYTANALVVPLPGYYEVIMRAHLTNTSSGVGAFVTISMGIDNNTGGWIGLSSIAAPQGVTVFASGIGANFGHLVASANLRMFLTAPGWTVNVTWSNINVGIRPLRVS